MSLIQDVRIAGRSLRARPTYAAISVLTIALVVAAASAVLAVINAAFVRPLPFTDAGRLAWIYENPPGTGSATRRNPLHSPVFVGLREHLQQADGVAGIYSRDRALTTSGEAASVSTGSISANYFHVLGLSPAIGRMFTDAEDVAGAKVAVLSDELWHERFGAAPSALGQVLVLDGEPHEIIGVMPPMHKAGFVSAELWTPLNMHPGNVPAPTATLVIAVARLRPGVALAQLDQQIGVIMTDVVKERAATLTGWTAGVMPLRDALFGQARPALVLLFAAVSLLTLIACANLVNVTIAEVTGRRDELALRAALGASRPAVVQLLALEHLIVALIGGGIGLAGARVLLPAMLSLDASTAAQVGDVPLDWRVSLAALSLALIVSVVSGILPALAGTTGNLARTLAQGGQRTAGSRRQARTRAWLVGVETLVASVLLTASALLLSAFDHTSRVNPGFDPTHVLLAQVRLPTTTYPTAAARAQVVTSMLEEVRHLPGIVGASTTFNPFQRGAGYQTQVTIEGRPEPDGQSHNVQFRRISPDYFRTMRIAELRGRSFGNADDANGLQVAVISEAFAKQFWPDQDPIGRRIIRIPDPTHPLTVVGVVADVSDSGLALAPAPTIYIAWSQNNTAAAPVTLVVRTPGDPTASIRDVTQALHRVDAALPLSQVTTLDAFLEDSLGADRFRSVLLLVFAGLGLSLAAVGIYGVTARGVSERTRELGVRLALGSGRAELWRLVLRRALAAVGIGLVGSVPAAALTLRTLSHWLPGVAAADPWLAVPAVSLLGVAGFLAAAVPALRAARLDPVTALRG